MRNRLFAGTAALAATTALIALPAGTANADAYASDGAVLYTANNVPVSPGDPMSIDLTNGTVATMNNPGTTTGVKCTASHLSGYVTSNPAATGSATASSQINALTFSGCTSNVVGVTGVTSLTMDYLPYTLSVTDSPGYPVTLAPVSGTQPKVTAILKTVTGTATCVYLSTGSTLYANATNVPPRINLFLQRYLKIAGPSICSANIDFTASYGPVTDTAPGNGGIVLVQ
ncbi:Tat pathway signal sequence domain protein [Kitasatospora sp. NPDC004615]|uniref:Tat pathway signal sequence domain protein n=1 Tax=Kitasatospora sp. NPDC004615 TaxID=3364017 RepID=UPI0036A103B2